jgi:alpha-L-fucosidase
MLTKQLLSSVLILLLSTHVLVATSIEFPTGDDRPLNEGAPYETKEQRDERMQWWRDGKFGMFIHYGLYAGLAGEFQDKKFHSNTEWIQIYSGADYDTYIQEALPRFNPQSGKAAEWVKLAKEAGCTYTVLTSRHHEGYNLFDTRFSDFNSLKTNGIDIVNEFAKACLENDMKIGYYVSIIDWNHPDYDPTGSGISYPQGNLDAASQGKRTFGNHEKYKDYLFNVFDELISNYPVDLIWWDFSQPNFQGDIAWGATRLMHRLFEKHPKAIQNNRLYHSDNHLSEGGIKVTPTWKGDYSTAENHVPPMGIDGDWEACQTLNGTWGYTAANHDWKSSETLIRELIDAVSRGGNYLLNIGPEADGSIPEASIKIFKEIGAWMNINNEAIYGTQANPFDIEFSWGRVTRKGDSTLYLHVYEKPVGGKLSIPHTSKSKATATLLHNGQQLSTTSNANTNETSIDLTAIDMQYGATVVKIVF